MTLDTDIKALDSRMVTKFDTQDKKFDALNEKMSGMAAEQAKVNGFLMGKKAGEAAETPKKR